MNCPLPLRSSSRTSRAGASSVRPDAGRIGLNPLAALLMCAAAGLSACGGGGSSSPAPATEPTPGYQARVEPKTQKVGGTIIGLDTSNGGAGLGLQLNGSEVLYLSGDGAFQFSGALKAGDDYAVTVKLQPSAPSQTCTVNAGTGTIKGSDVADVSIKCSTNVFKVSGSVSGLLGTGLVLTNNGGDDLTVADGRFSFSTPVVSGADYLVRVKASPTTPNQNCSVYLGNGLIRGAAIDNVQVSCSTQQYQAVATVNGLVGLIGLQVNNLMPVYYSSSGGAYSMGLSFIADGSPYAVTVVSQPTNQTCTVSNPTGVVSGTGPIVTVNCDAAAQEVGVSVSGYDGEGLVLQNNGADDLAISADGAFKFSVKVASGQPYNVTIRNAPKTPDQVCAVSNGTGVIGSFPAAVHIACETPAATAMFFGNGAGHDGQAPGVNPRSFVSPGVLGGLGAFPATIDRIEGLVVDPTGQVVYAIDDANVYRFPILAGMPIGLGAGVSIATTAGNSSIAMDPLGRYLVVLNKSRGEVSTYRYNEGTQQLVPQVSVNGLIGPTAASIDPTGRFITVTNGDYRTITTFAVSAQGLLTEGRDSDVKIQPSTVAFNPAGTRVFIGHKGENKIVSGYLVSETTAGGEAAYRTVIANEKTTSEAPYHVAIMPNGKYLVAVQGPPGTRPYVVVYATALSGALTEVSRTQAQYATNVRALVLEPSGKYLHVIDALYDEVLTVNRSGVIQGHGFHYFYPLGDLTSAAVLK